MEEQTMLAVLQKKDEQALAACIRQYGTALALPEGWGVDGGTRSAYGGEGYYMVECEFGALLDPADVAAVTVNGVEIPVA